MDASDCSHWLSFRKRRLLSVSRCGCRTPAVETLEPRWTLSAKAVVVIDAVPYGSTVIDESHVAPMPGDANQDLSFDQRDIAQVLQAGKYLTAEPAGWSEGDWNGDGVFDSVDIVAALRTGHYAADRQAAIAPNGALDDNQTSIIYDPATGEVALDAPADRELTSINIDSVACIFTGALPMNTVVFWESDPDCNIFKATFGSSFGSLSFGNVAQTGLSYDFIQNDLTVIGSLAGGGELGEVDLVYVAPDFSRADFSGQDLTDADFSRANLTDANLSGANLSGADFRGATLRGADFTGAIVVDADFGNTTDRGFTAQQLYGTGSYQQVNLSGIDLSRNDLRGWNFAGQNLERANLGRSDLSAGLEMLPDQTRFTVASFAGADLTGTNLADSDLSGADFTAANVTGANFAGAFGFTKEQLFSTASYEKRNLSDVDLSRHDLSGWNFAGQFLVGASFREATLTGADFSAAIVNGATFRGTTAKGFTAEQLYGTTSYQRFDSSGIDLGDNDLSGWNFAAQNLSGVSLDHAKLADADFAEAAMSGADLTQAVISGADFRGARGFVADQLYGTASYQNKQLARTGFGELNLTGWSFAEQDLTEATFVDAVLRDADFSRATLSNAVLDGASFDHANLSRADLTGSSLKGAFRNCGDQGARA